MWSSWAPASGVVSAPGAGRRPPRSEPCERAGFRRCWPLLPPPSLPPAHEAVRWWNAAHEAGEQAAQDAAAPTPRIDVFGVRRPDLPTADAAGKRLSRMQFLGLRPGSDERVAAAAGVEGVVCSGQGPNEVQARLRPAASALAPWSVGSCCPARPRRPAACCPHPLAPPPQVATESHANGKAVFVESLVRAAAGACRKELMFPLSLLRSPHCRRPRPTLQPLNHARRSASSPATWRRWRPAAAAPR